MLFNSAQFLIFFPLVTAAYFLLPHRYRAWWLLAASCYFYMCFKAIYIFILAFTIAVDYSAGILIENATGTRRRLYLLMSICANAGVLAGFKYFNFLNDNFRSLSAVLGFHYPIPDLGILLPIGLSFHTFQSLSYTIEVYRGCQKAERKPHLLAVYVMFYPQLVAGPIERPQNLLHQFYERHYLEYTQVVSGLKLMLWGFIKKVVIADRLAPFVNQVYSNPHDYPGISLIIATLFFGIQIYCDFSGYSDIAIGAARVMGFRLMKNFDRPYFSASVAEFWRRWHISLSTWFRDYVYFPLGGSRVPVPRWYANLMITFLISGLWHGASWTYVIWGGLNGIYLVIEQILKRSFGQSPPYRATLAAFPAGYRFLRTCITFALISFAWIFFRAKTFADARYIAGHLGAGLTRLPAQLQNPAFQKVNILMRLDKTEFLIAVAAICVLFAVELLQSRVSVSSLLSAQPAWLRWSFYYAAIMVLVFFGAYSSSQEFIYFQF
ncbi:MAG TPA: MBOAT family O-acyltransferase [Bryobacteraceae bacterium]|nr:MBOAT family O-acyltransferase [Bryobacteraceae bacterium]